MQQKTGNELRQEFIEKVRNLPYMKARNDDLLYVDFEYKGVGTLRIVKNLLAVARLTYAGFPIFRHLINDVCIVRNGWRVAELHLSNRTPLSGEPHDYYEQQDRKFWAHFYDLCQEIQDKAKTEMKRNALRLRFIEARRDLKMWLGSRRILKGRG